MNKLHSRSERARERGREGARASEDTFLFLKKGGDVVTYEIEIEVVN